MSPTHYKIRGRRKTVSRGFVDFYSRLTSKLHLRNYIAKRRSLYYVNIVPAANGIQGVPLNSIMTGEVNFTPQYSVPNAPADGWFIPTATLQQDPSWRRFSTE